MRELLALRDALCFLRLWGKLLLSDEIPPPAIFLAESV
jgi:hypothetical protein